MISKVLRNIALASLLFSSPLWAFLEEEGSNNDKVITSPKKPNLQNNIESLPKELHGEISVSCLKELSILNSGARIISQDSLFWINLIQKAGGVYEGREKTAQDEFFGLGDRANLIWADFLAKKQGNKELAGRYYDKVLNSFLYGTTEDLQIEAQIGKCTLGLWPYYDSYRIQRLQRLLQRASLYPSITPEKQARAQLCLALGRHHFSRDESFSMTPEKAFELFNAVSQNPQASAKDQARAKFWKAKLWLDFRRTAPFDARVAYGLFVEVSQDPEAAPEDRADATWYTDHPHLHPPYFNPTPPPQPQ